MATIHRDPDVLDDLHYADGEEVSADEKVPFSLDGKSFEIDLTEAHAKEFRAKFETEIAVATEVQPPRPPSTRRRSPGSGSNPSRPDRDLTKNIREWAAGQDIKLNPQGRIPNDVRNAYFDAHPSERPAESQ